jgi:hypothetical protein
MGAGDVIAQVIRFVGVRPGQVEYEFQHLFRDSDAPVSVVVAVLTTFSLPVAGSFVAFNSLIPYQARQGEIVGQAQRETAGDIICRSVLGEKIR